MNTINNWEIAKNGKNIRFDFEGMSTDTTAVMTINGTRYEFNCVKFSGIGKIAYFIVHDSEYYLRILSNGQIDLASDGIYMNSGKLLEKKVFIHFTGLSPDPKLSKKISGARGSFMMFVILTYVNILLSVIRADVYMLFSATVPYVLAQIGVIYSDLFGDSLFLVLYGAAAVLCGSAYLLLYLLTKKHNWAAWISFFLIIADTIILIYFSRESFADSMIDIVFHVWVIFSMITLIINRRTEAEYWKSEILNRNYNLAAVSAELNSRPDLQLPDNSSAQYPYEQSGAYNEVNQIYTPETQAAPEDGLSLDYNGRQNIVGKNNNSSPSSDESIFDFPDIEPIRDYDISEDDKDSLR